MQENCLNRDKELERDNMKGETRLGKGQRRRGSGETMKGD